MKSSRGRSAAKARKKRKIRTAVLSVKRGPTKESILESGRIALLPAYQAADTIERFAGGAQTNVDLLGLIVELNEQTSNVATGDLSRGEAMLVAQAHTLDAIFNNCARRAAMNMGEFMGAAETYLRLALKAQSQCRTTWETLAEIKNPRSVAFVRQANVTTGPQQVNNGPVPDQGSRARETVNEPSKLLEATDGERLDIGTAGTTGSPDTHVEAVGAIHRSENGPR